MFAGIALSLLIIAISWWFGWLRLERPAQAQQPPAVPPPPPTAVRDTKDDSVWAPQRPSEDELSVQHARCEDVKTRTLDAAQRLKEALAAGDERTNDVKQAIDDLVAVKAENEGDGALGVIAMTELCNALLQADALDSLNALQQHADAHIAQQGEALFQSVVPRIWSF
mmetsp:Transcript_26344/g.52901  ORF Transcript_26344/g.52901 Transcript_26344/m.52901 type:complete len:168 (-) Transcript_26344:107-610(-)